MINLCDLYLFRSIFSFQKIHFKGVFLPLFSMANRLDIKSMPECFWGGGHLGWSHVYFFYLFFLRCLYICFFCFVFLSQSQKWIQEEWEIKRQDLYISSLDSFPAPKTAVKFFQEALHETTPKENVCLLQSLFVRRVPWKLVAPLLGSTVISL